MSLFGSSSLDLCALNDSAFTGLICMKQFGCSLILKRLLPVFSWSFLSDKLWYLLKEEYKNIFSLSVAPWDLPWINLSFITTMFTKYIFCLYLSPLPFPATQKYNNSNGFGLYHTKFPWVAARVCTPVEQSKPLTVFSYFNLLLFLLFNLLHK